MVEDPLQHGRDQEGAGNPMVPDKADPLAGVKAGLDHQGVARVQAAQQAQRSAHMEIGNTHDGGVGIDLGPERRGEAAESGTQHPVADGHCLGQARGPAGEEDEGLFAVGADRRVGCCRRGPEELRRGQHVPAYRNAPRRGKGIAGDSQRSTSGRVHQGRDLARAQGRIDERGGRAHPGCGQGGRHRDDAADIDDRDPISGPDSPLGQAGHGPPDHVVELTVGAGTVVHDQGHPGGKPPDGGIADVADVDAAHLGRLPVGR